MKVMHLISGGDTGGAKTHIHLLLKHLNEQCRAELVCFARGPFSEGAEALGIPTTVVEKPLPSALREVRRMLRGGGYDILHCHGSRGNLTGALLKGSAGLPLVTTVHSDPRLDYLGRPLARLSYGNLNALALRRMDHWIGVSDAMRETLISRGFDANRVYAIYNGVEFDDLRPAAPGERAAFFRSVGLDADENSVVVGIGARLDPVKDLPTLLRGFAKAYETRPQLRLLIAGEGPERGSLEALVRALGLSGAVCFAGWLEDMGPFYRSIDVNTLVSLSETFSYAVTEGARERVPVISSRVGGLPKLVIPGETGFLFTPGDAEALGGYIGALADDPALRKRLGDALFEKTRNEYSAAATARRQMEIYRHILDAAKRGRSGAVICGAYGMKNAGDEAVLDAILAELKSIDPWMDLTVVSRDPADTRAAHGAVAVHSFDLPALRRALRRSALYVNGGGSLIQDVTSSRSIWYYLYTLSAARRQGCRVMMYGCGVGPVNRPFNRRLAARVVNRNVDAVTLREEQSLEVLRQLGVTAPEITVAAEPALSLLPAPEDETDALLSRLGLEPHGDYFCLCVRRWPGMQQKTELFAAAAVHAWNAHGLTPVLFAANPEQDADVARQVRKGIGDGAPCLLVTDALSAPENLGFFSRMRLVLAMRLHALIFAASQAVPLVGVSYDPKVAAFLASAGQRACVEFEALTAPEQLCALIDAAVVSDREALRASVAALREKERANVETARRMLSSGE